MKFIVGMLLSYDYKLLKKSIPIIYPYVDCIILSEDNNRKTWKNSKFIIDPSFFIWLINFDSNKKIIIYSGNFYKKKLNTIENECRQRNILSKQMSGVIWYIQLDCDEYFINFKDFLFFLKKQISKSIKNKREKIQIACFLFILFKNDNDGFFYVSNPLERVLVATNYIDYKNGRMNNAQILYSPFIILHQSWARKKQDLIYKINNWGHTDEFNKTQYIKFWESINQNNYFKINNFHPTEPKKWKKLNYIKAKNIEEIKDKIKKTNILSISKFHIFKKNLGQCIKHLNFNPLFRDIFY